MERRRDVVSLVERLRQEKEFISFYKAQIQQSVQLLNGCCDRLFCSMWLNHALGRGLKSISTGSADCLEWSSALMSADSVQFADAFQVLQSPLLIEKYSSFLSLLRREPKLVVEVVNWTELEGLNTSCVVSDLVSVVYGHCIFGLDHQRVLQVVKILLKQHIDGCKFPYDLFSQTEPVLSCMISEYCTQLTELKTFLSEALQEPVMRVLECAEYLEYDISKAASRLQSKDIQSWSVGQTTQFLFSEDLQDSCDTLARLSSSIVCNLLDCVGLFPCELACLFRILKLLVREKWPYISVAEMQCLIGTMLFGNILGSAIVNPDNWGLVPQRIIIDPKGRYNLCQVVSVLQGCGWALHRNTNVSKYPVHRVVNIMNVKAYNELLEVIDGGYKQDPGDLPSAIPGLRRNSFLVSEAQLHSLASLITTMVDSYRERDSPPPASFFSSLQSTVRDLISSIPRSHLGPPSISRYSLVSHHPSSSPSSSSVLSASQGPKSKSSIRKRSVDDFTASQGAPQRGKISSAKSNKQVAEDFPISYGKSPPPPPPPPQDRQRDSPLTLGRRSTVQRPPPGHSGSGRRVRQTWLSRKCQRELVSNNRSQRFPLLLLLTIIISPSLTLRAS